MSVGYFNRLNVKPISQLIFVLNYTFKPVGMTRTQDGVRLLSPRIFCYRTVHVGGRRTRQEHFYRTLILITTEIPY